MLFMPQLVSVCNATSFIVFQIQYCAQSFSFLGHFISLTNQRSSHFCPKLAAQTKKAITIIWDVVPFIFSTASEILKEKATT